MVIVSLRSNLDPFTSITLLWARWTMKALCNSLKPNLFNHNDVLMICHHYCASHPTSIFPAGVLIYSCMSSSHCSDANVYFPGKCDRKSSYFYVHVLHMCNCIYMTGKEVKWKSKWFKVREEFLEFLESLQREKSFMIEFLHEFEKRRERKVFLSLAFLPSTQSH